jgi:malonyl-CoA O-methyltransferase
VRLNTEYLPASDSARQDLVLLHGWGSDREIWRRLLAQLRPWANVTLVDLPGCAPVSGDSGAPALAELVAALSARAPESAVLLGWSLGGQLALEMAAREPGRVAAVVTLCSNPRFVASGDWPGMPAADFDRFEAGYGESASNTLRRFDSLQAGGADRPTALLRELRATRNGAAAAGLQAGLEWLRQLDQRQLLSRLRTPQLHLLAGRDALVPAAALRTALSRLTDGGDRAEIDVLPEATHLAPLDSADAVAARTRDFLAGRGLLRERRPLPATPAKKDVAASFSRAASQYDSVASLQRAVGGRLLEKMRSWPGSPATVLDLGCGTGGFRQRLRQRFERARYIGLDLAPGMVDYARSRAAEDDGWVVGDAEALPLAAGSMDLVFSSLAIQWCARPEQLFAELARVLAPGGRCFFSSLGPDTLRELRAAWRAVDARRHVNDFLPAAALEAAASRVPGLQLTLATEVHRMHYHRVGELLAELKTLGAHNMNRGRPAGLTSRRVLQGMLEAYEAHRKDGLLPATYEVIFGEVHRE